MRVRQGALTVVTRIRAGAEGELRSALARIDEDVEANEWIPFARLSTLHFGRWVILPEVRAATGAVRFPAQLVLSTSFDGPRVNHLEELVRVGRRALDEVYRHCEGYAGAGRDGDVSVVRYLDRHAVPESIFYVGAPGLDVERIRREGELRDAVEDFLDGFEAWRPPAAGPDPGEVRKAVLAFVRDRPELSWALADPGPGPRPFPWYGWVALVLGGLLLAPLLAAWLVLVRLSEPGEGRPDRAGTEAPTGGPAPGAAEAHVQELREHENRIVQNELSHVVEVRPGWVPRTTLRLLFPLLDWAGRRIYNQGQLLGVRTLHFVRWVTIDQGRRVLFLTNYDGGMVGYVADFVERSWQIPSVLTAIWSNTTGFPRTRWLFLEGARDVVRFTAFLRDHQVPTQVWYSGYKTLTTGNIVNNAAVHRGLSGEMADQEAAGWLRRL